MNNNIYSQVFNALNGQSRTTSSDYYYDSGNQQQGYAQPQQPNTQTAYNNYNEGLGYSQEYIAQQRKNREMEKAMDNQNNAIGTIISELDMIKGDLLNGYNDLLSRINEAGQGVYQNNSDIKNLVDSS